MNQTQFARQVLDTCLRLRTGDRVWINSWDHTLEIASGLAWECEKRGYSVLTTIQHEKLWLRNLIEGSPADRLSDHQKALLEKTDVYIYTMGPREPVPWDLIPEKNREAITLWFLENNTFVEEWKAIAIPRRVRMLGIEATLATPERAKLLGLNWEEWRNVMLEGCLADHAEVARRAQKLAGLLGGNEEVRVSTSYGTDLKFRLDNRPLDIGDGLSIDERAAEGRAIFLPTGGIEASADEESAEGTVVFDSPRYYSWVLRGGGPVEMLTVKLEKGRVVGFQAKSRAEVFEQYLKTGKGDVNRFAFFGFGLNPNLRPGFTQDDKVLGCFTVGFGRNSDKAGKNRGDTGYWASMTKATVKIGGRTVMRDGNLLI
jgi:leucyl aminopeptidase (aminopeptidase T)